jgi:molecular chaperone DnaJ
VSTVRAFLYEILEVSRTARPAVIRAAFRCLAQEYHPDKNPGNAEAAARMAMINHAYSVLIDPLQRARYDRSCTTCTDERRGRGNTANSPGQNPAGDRANPRPFAFRHL